MPWLGLFKFYIFRHSVGSFQSVNSWFLWSGKLSWITSLVSFSPTFSILSFYNSYYSKVGLPCKILLYLYLFTIISEHSSYSSLLEIFLVLFLNLLILLCNYLPSCILISWGFLCVSEALPFPTPLHVCLSFLSLI